jgi:hypothetical protein
VEGAPARRQSVSGMPRARLQGIVIVLRDLFANAEQGMSELDPRSQGHEAAGQMACADAVRGCPQILGAAPAPAHTYGGRGLGGGSGASNRSLRGLALGAAWLARPYRTALDAEMGCTGERNTEAADLRVSSRGLRVRRSGYQISALRTVLSRISRDRARNSDGPCWGADGWHRDIRANMEQT